MKKFIYSLIFFVFVTAAMIIMDVTSHAKFVTYTHNRWYWLILAYVIGAVGPFAYEEYINDTAGDPSPAPVAACWLIGVILAVLPWALSLGS